MCVGANQILNPRTQNKYLHMRKSEGMDADTLVRFLLLNEISSCYRKKEKYSNAVVDSKLSVLCEFVTTFRFANDKNQSSSDVAGYNSVRLD